MTQPDGESKVRRRLRRPPTVRRAGIFGAVLGVAAGLAAGVATQRSLVRRSRNGVVDPYADEPFGRQHYDDTCVISTADGTDVYVEVVESTDGAAASGSEPGAAASGSEPGAANPADLPTVVFVHGFCLDMCSFYFQRAALTEQLLRGGLGKGSGFRMVFYDQPGHGLSGLLETGEYELPALGETLRAVIERMAPQGPLVLVGHSMGGMTIMAFAELYPEMFDDRVAGVVLIATSGGLLEETKFGLPALVSRFGAPLLPLVNNATRLSGSMIERARQASSDLAWLLTRRYGFGSHRPSPALVSFVEQMNSRTSVRTVARYLRTLYTHARYPALITLRGTPTLVIVGDKDTITPVTHSEEILRRLPHADFVRVPDSGHVVMLEHPDEVNGALIRFLKRLMA